MERRAQAYGDAVAQQRMDQGLCPECGQPSTAHANDNEWWKRPWAECSLRQDGVEDRVAQFITDKANGAAYILKEV